MFTWEYTQTEDIIWHTQQPLVTNVKPVIYKCQSITLGGAHKLLFLFSLWFLFPARAQVHKIHRRVQFGMAGHTNLMPTRPTERKKMKEKYFIEGSGRAQGRGFWAGSGGGWGGAQGREFGAGPGVERSDSVRLYTGLPWGRPHTWGHVASWPGNVYDILCREVPLGRIFQSKCKI